MKPTPDVPTRRGVSFNPGHKTYTMRMIRKNDQVGDYVHRYAVADYGSIEAAFNAACHDQQLVWGETDRHKARAKLNLPYLPMNKRHHNTKPANITIPVNPWDAKIEEQRQLVTKLTDDLQLAEGKLQYYEVHAKLFADTFVRS